MEAGRSDSGRPILPANGRTRATYAAASGDSASWGAGEFNYPQEDANVLCVGGTSLVTNGAGGTWRSETGWADSGGGISPDHIAIPSWQHTPKVVNNQNHASRTLRNGPDVAAEGDFQNWICHDGGCDGGWGAPASPVLNSLVILPWPTNKRFHTAIHYSAS